MFSLRNIRKPGRSDPFQNQGAGEQSQHDSATETEKDAVGLSTDLKSGG